MVLGVGIDMVRIAKIEKAVKKWKHSFIDKVFVPEEIRVISPGKIYYQRLAARFAAKEAVMKATSKSFPLGFRDIVILNRDNGAPYCKIKKKDNLDILLSISHIEDYAIACAVVQKV